MLRRGPERVILNARCMEWPTHASFSGDRFQRIPTTRKASTAFKLRETDVAKIHGNSSRSSVMLLGMVLAASARADAMAVMPVQPA
jgi:hypothetical protein